VTSFLWEESFSLPEQLDTPHPDVPAVFSWQKALTLFFWVMTGGFSPFLPCASSWEFLSVGRAG